MKHAYDSHNQARRLHTVAPGAGNFHIQIRQIPVTVSRRGPPLTMNHPCFTAQESEMLSESARQMGWNIHYDQREPGRFAGVADHARDR